MLDISPFNTTALSAFSDTSTGIVHHQSFRDLLADCVLASSDWFSIDALTALFLITDQNDLISPDILQKIARTSLYARGLDREILHIVFILNSWLNASRSPLRANIFQQGHTALATVLFEELLPRLHKIIEKVDYLERYWIDEERNLEITENFLDSESVELTELKDFDLAVFAIAPEEIEEKGKLFQGQLSWVKALHPIALHNRTSCSRILLQAGQRSHFYFRTESLARSNPTAFPGKELTSLMFELNNSTASALWVTDQSIPTRPSLFWSGDTPPEITANEVLRAVTAFLQN